MKCYLLNVSLKTSSLADPKYKLLAHRTKELRIMPGNTTLSCFRENTSYWENC